MGIPGLFPGPGRHQAGSYLCAFVHGHLCLENSSPLFLLPSVQVVLSSWKPLALIPPSLTLLFRLLSDSNRLLP